MLTLKSTGNKKFNRKQCPKTLCFGKETFFIEIHKMKASETCRIHLQVTSPKPFKDF
jgi:hypothetical protein